MKERPILMSAPMVRAILDGTKTQTRRVVKPTMTAPKVAPLHMEPWIIDGEQEIDDHGLPCWSGFHPDYPGEAKWFSCPYGGIGERLWVRETHALVPMTAYRASDGVQQTIDPNDPDHAAIYRAGWDRSDPGTRWRPSIFMPRWASRITLEITDVRVQRVQEITVEDAMHEGITAPMLNDKYSTMRGGFSILWDEINAARGYDWASNPWVWALTFRRVI